MSKKIKLREKISRMCISISDGLAHPMTIVLFPIGCVLYIWLGGTVNTLTLILSIVAISLTQMVLNAQNVDAAATKLQIAELVRAIPEARNKVIKQDLTEGEIEKLSKEIDNDVTS